MSESSELRWGLSENPTSKRHIEPRKNSRPMLSEDPAEKTDAGVFQLEMFRW